LLSIMPNVMIDIKGSAEVIANLDTKLRKRAGRGVERGLKSAGKFLLRKSKEIVPVQTGKLKGSSHITKVGSGLRTSVFVGYTADYAVWVHEDLDKAHGAAFNRKYADLIATRSQRAARRRKMGLTTTVANDPYFKRGEYEQAKYLEKPARDNRQWLLAAISSEIALSIA